MSEPYIQGQKLHKAFWTRSGLRIEAGTVILASAEQCIVVCADTSTESISQRNPGGWRPSKQSALENLLDRLGVTLRKAEAETLRVRACIQSTKTMLSHADQLEERI